jgi:Tfp pilus assembly protein PilV
MKREQGFTIVEVIIAIIVLTVGILGLVTSAALVTRMIGRGQRSAVAARYSQMRLEMLRASGCKAQAGGSEVWWRGGVPIDSVSWTFTNLGPKHWQVVVRSNYQTALGKWRNDSTETEISCLF